MTKEHAIQNNIRMALLERGYLVIRQNVGEGWVGDPAIQRSDGSVIIGNARRFSSGMPRGWPDLMVIGSGGIVGFIEVKTSKGKPSQHQLVALNKLKSLGIRAGIARSPKEAISIMEDENNV